MSGRRTAVGTVVLLMALAVAARADRVAYQGQFLLGVRGVMDMSEVGKDPVVLPRVPGADQDNITPSLSSDGSRVAFAAKKDGYFQIFNWRLGPSNQVVGEAQQITSDEQDHLLPVWSPDDSSMAYVAGVGETYALYSMKADGSDPLKVADLTAGYEAASPTWSPDSSRLAFSREGQLWVVGADGTGLEKLRDDGWYPAWSPDGATIAYAERTPAPALATITPDGATRRVLLKDVEGVGGIAWGPGGRRIALKAASVNGKPSNLWVVNADGTSPRPMKAYGLPQGSISWRASAKAASMGSTPGRAPSQPSELEPVVLLSPAPEAEVHGQVALMASKQNPGGYVIFRADDRFLYATAAPFQYQWDTRLVPDGSVTLDVVGYDNRAELEGEASLTVKIHNAISEAEIPAQGLLLRDTLKGGAGWSSGMRATSSISGASQSAANQMAALDARLTARWVARIEDVAADQSSATLSSRLESGSLVRAGQDTTLPDLKRSARQTLRSTGLIRPALGRSATVRIGLAELSLQFDPAPVKPGDSWNAPLITIIDLATQKVVELPARHTLEGVQWYGQYRAVRIKSAFTAPSIALTSGVLPPAGVAPAAAPAAAPPPRRNRLDTDMTDDDDDQGGAPAPSPGYAPAAPPIAAAQTTLPAGVTLSDVSGTRTTWFAYETGAVLRIEQTLQGRVQVGAEFLNYTLNLEINTQPTAAASY